MFCVLKRNSFHEQVFPGMIPNGEECHYLSVKKLSALLGGITSKKPWWILLPELSSFFSNRK